MKKLAKRTRQTKTTEEEKKMRQSRKTKITLEQYTNYYLQPGSGTNLSCSRLNQILQFHGSNGLHHDSKANILKCLDSINLTIPTRSTLWSISSRDSPASLTPPEVAGDLLALGWEEQSDPFISVYNLSVGPFFCEHLTATYVPAAVTTEHKPRRRGVQRAPPADFVVAGRRPRSKRRIASINALNSVDSTASNARDYAIPITELCTRTPSYPRSPTPPLPDSPYPSSPSSPSWAPSTPYSDLSSPPSMPSPQCSRRGY